MAQYCPNCGKKLEDGARFCSFCGQTITSEKTDNAIESVRTCPNCGAPIKAFSLSCPVCGYEFQSMRASSGLAQFTRQLEEIEKRRPISSALDKIASAFTRTKSKTDEEKMNLIRNYSIPNTKEDIYEFFVLASSNLTPSAFGEASDSPERLLAEAWFSKFEQAYEKAKLTFSDDPLFESVLKTYKKKKLMVFYKRNASTIGFIISILFLLLLPLIIKLF